MAQPATQAPADSQLLNLRVPPHSIDAEQSVLGGLLIDNGAFDKIGDMVVERDFYRDDHRRIFRHIARLIEKGKPADVVTVDESIKASEDKDKTGGIAYLAALADNTPSAHNVRRYAEIVREHATRRELQAVVNEAHDLAARGDPGEVRAQLIERLSAIRTSHAVTETGILRPVTLEHFLGIEIPIPEALLGTLITKHWLGLLYSWRGVGKTWAASGRAYAIASG